MKIVVALGGNALLRRNQDITSDSQRAAIHNAASLLAAEIAAGHHLTVTHGNGPQVGLLALQSYAAPKEMAFPLDVLDAETEGWIGYGIELELRNALPAGADLATLLTLVRVDLADLAFTAPRKPIGPIYTVAEARQKAEENHWSICQDGEGWRRVVASPQPLAIMEIKTIKRLINGGTTVICAGGGGIPVFETTDGKLSGVEAVIDKDATSALLARQIGADLFVMLTDVGGVFLDFGTDKARMITTASPDALDAQLSSFTAGSMGPKVAAACTFARLTGQRAAIGALADLPGIICGTHGTSVSMGQNDMAFGSC
jgi:carbamate kinase